MTETRQIYKCDVCGNIVEVVHAGPGQLVCCGQPMTHLKENSVDAAKEKHVPVIEVLDGEIVVKVGSVLHPMVEEHFIEWIELQSEDRIFRKFLRPGDTPEAHFKVCDTNKPFTAREYCNIHGLWSASK